MGDPQLLSKVLKKKVFFDFRIKDIMNVKIGVSVDVEDRMRNLQTSNPYKLDIIKSFDAGVEAYKHEKHFHDLYKTRNNIDPEIEKERQRKKQERLRKRET